MRNYRLLKTVEAWNTKFKKLLSLSAGFETNYVDLPHSNSSEGRRFRNPKRWDSLYLFHTSPPPTPHKKRMDILSWLPLPLSPSITTWHAIWVPDPHGSALIWVAGSGSGSAFKLRIRIQEGKNDTQKRKKSRIFMFWSAGCSLLRADGFTCSLGALYWGLGISKKQFLIKKIKI